MEGKPMTPITLQRFVQELDKLKQEVDAGTLQSKDYDGRLARIIGELRDRGLDADRAAATAALADAVTRGVITAPVQAHIHNRLGLLHSVT
jgi:predicted Zn-dependent peptidase